jgi:hypothetical protein
MDIILTVIGALFGWFANHLYSRQGSKELRDRFGEQAELIAKMPASFLAALHEDQRSKLSVRELNELLKKFTTTGDGDVTACQQCGSTSLNRDGDADVDYDGDGGASLNYYIDSVTCDDCGWQHNEYSSRDHEVFARETKEGGVG